MKETIDRLYHCHKARKNVHTFEDYETRDGNKKLVEVFCPEFHENKCNGYNDYNISYSYTSIDNIAEINMTLPREN